MKTVRSGRCSSTILAVNKGPGDDEIYRIPDVRHSHGSLGCLGYLLWLSYNDLKLRTRAPSHER